MDQPAAARWLPIDAGVNRKDVWVRVRTCSCGLEALGSRSYVACLVRGIVIVKRVCSQQRLVGFEVFVGALIYHRRESVITAEVTDSDCQT